METIFPNMKQVVKYDGCVKIYFNKDFILFTTLQLEIDWSHFCPEKLFLRRSFSSCTISIEVFMTRTHNLTHHQFVASHEISIIFQSNRYNYDIYFQTLNANMLTANWIKCKGKSRLSYFFILWWSTLQIKSVTKQGNQFVCWVFNIWTVPKFCYSKWMWTLRSDNCYWLTVAVMNEQR
jgi:hypothetical protein